MELNTEIDIDNVQYEIIPLLVTDSLRMFHKLVKIIGPSALMGKDDSTGNENGETWAKAADLLFQKLDEKTFLEISQKLATEGIRANGKKISFDVHYGEYPSHILPIIGKSLEVNYKRFLDTSKLSWLTKISEKMNLMKKDQASTSLAH